MKFKKLACILLSALTLITATACGKNDSSSASNSQSGTSNEAFVKNGLTGKTSAEIVSDMGFGFNVGNTLDADSGKVSDVLKHEVAWGNPVISQQLIDSVADAGFTTVRIPTTWESFISEDGSYTIDEAYLARVKEVVDYCYNNDMYVILNTHHEKWIENADLVKNKEDIAKQLDAVWTQIADYFAEYDQHLIFEGLNEPRLKGTQIEWTGNSEGYETMNYFSQVFTNAVRRNGKGYNDERCLMITGYAASNSASIMRAMSIPTYNGEAVNNIIVSVHSYAPYDFCLNTKQQTFDFNNPADAGAIDSVFEAIKTEFLDHGIPVIIGETGATGKEDKQQRANWITYMGTKAAEYGVPIVLWDNGAIGNGSENHCYFSRHSGEILEPEFIDSMMKAKNDTQWGIALESDSDSQESLVGGTVIASYPDGITSVSLWDNSYIAMGASENYFYGDRKIAIVYSGEGQPKLILDSSEMNQWWIPVEPDAIESLGDKQVAYFSSENIENVLGNFNISSFSQLRNLSVAAANDNITTYEISVIGENPNVIYKVNGATYHVGTDIPENPSVENMEFIGWYSTKDYREGTEFSGETDQSDMIVYAKFKLAE